ncbi:unnamed protein product, partial [Porites lobata]
LSQSVIQVEEQGDTSSRRSSIRQPVTTQSRVFERICVFCEKAKYLKGTKTREAPIQCVDLCADSTIRRAAVGKNDPRILAIVTRELVAAEACYHKSCYRDYTRNIQGAVSSESQAYENFFTYIETRLLQNPRIVRMVELYTLFTSFLKSQGVKEIKESTRTHFRRNLEGEFRDTLDFEDLSGNKRIFVIPRSLSRLDLAKQVMESCDCSS